MLGGATLVARGCDAVTVAAAQDDGAAKDVGLDQVGAAVAQGQIDALKGSEAGGSRIVEFARDEGEAAVAEALGASRDQYLTIGEQKERGLCAGLFHLCDGCEGLTAAAVHLCAARGCNASGEDVASSEQYPFTADRDGRVVAAGVNRHPAGDDVRVSRVGNEQIGGHLIALDTKTGRVIWDKVMADFRKGYQYNVAPLIVRNMVILGPANNESGANCWMAAYDIKTGREIWRFNTAPTSADDPIAKTWTGESWKHGGNPIWNGGSYDPETNLTYWGTGNPNPGWNGDSRLPADNLYSDSVIALDADTGKLKWHFQFTPGDEYDWDSTQVPVLVDMEWKGQPRKLMLWGNRNGFFYVLDRTTGEFLMGKAFIKQNWALGLDAKGRPIKDPARWPKAMGGTYVEPSSQGGTNWYPPSYSPRTGLFYLGVWDNYGGVSPKGDPGPWIEGRRYTGTGQAPGGRGVAAAGRGGTPAGGRGPARAPANHRTEEEGYGAIRALDPKTGEKKWDFKMAGYTESGVMSTAGDLVFGGGMDGTFVSLDARTGEVLWHANLGGPNASGPISYAVNGKQYIVGTGEGTMYVFALPD